MRATSGGHRGIPIRTIICGLLFAVLSHGAAFAQAPTMNRPAIQPPKSILNIAATLRAMGRGDVASQLIKDFRSGRVVIGSPGSNAMTAPPIIIPGVTGRGNNIMILDRSLENVCDIRQTDKNPVTHGTLTWALTVFHEYVHMNQDNPQQAPRFENGAWSATVEENQKWMRSIMSQITNTELHMPNGPDKIAQLKQLTQTLNDLRTIHNTTINDLKQEIGAGSVSAGLDWPTLDMGRTKDLDQVAANGNNLVNTFNKNTQESIARFQKDLLKPAQPLTLPDPTVTKETQATASSDKKDEASKEGKGAGSPSGKHTVKDKSPETGDQNTGRQPDDKDIELRDRVIAALKGRGLPSPDALVDRLADILDREGESAFFAALQDITNMQGTFKGSNMTLIVKDFNVSGTFFDQSEYTTPDAKVIITVTDGQAKGWVDPAAGTITIDLHLVSQAGGGQPQQLNQKLVGSFTGRGYQGHMAGEEDSTWKVSNDN